MDRATPILLNGRTSQREPSRAQRRPWWLVGIVGLALAIAHGPSPADARSPTAHAEDLAGRVFTSQFFIGVTLQRRGASRVRIQAYVCNGRGSAFLFTGSTTTRSVDLTSKDGKAHLHARIAADGVSGSFRLGHTVHRFGTRRARRFGGIWVLRYTSAHHLSGTTGAGARFVGRVTSTFRIVGIFTRAGRRFHLDQPLTRPHEDPHFRQFRVAVLDDGHGHGKGIGTRITSSVISCDAY